MTQEELSGESFHMHCYIPLSTLKRAERGKRLSRNTVKKIALFFSVDIHEIMLETNNEQESCHQTIINWDRIDELKASPQYTQLFDLCLKIKKEIESNSLDTTIKRIFINRNSNIQHH